MFERVKSLGPLFVAVVVLPTVLALLYFGMLAEDIYVSESRILVRSPSKPNASPLGNFLGADAVTGATEEANAVREFLQSRAALQQVNKGDLVRRAYGAPGIFWLDRFGGLGGESFEHLYRYFAGKMWVEDGESILVLRLRVEAFEPSRHR